jgi:two-component system, LytTR family, response regulator
MILKTLLADDESLARRRLRQLLTVDPDIDIVDECSNGDEVIASLKKTSVDLLFLDIQMPGNTGFEVIEAIGAARMPMTVFVTAHNNYAVDAFGVHALDYLVKPVDEERLRVTLVHVKKKMAAEAALTMQTQLNSFLQNIKEVGSGGRAYPERILIPNGSEDSLVAVNDIEWIEAADDYACIHVGSKTMMLRQTIRQLAESLDSKKFIRVHRSAIVNIDYVRKILREGRTDGWLLLASGHRIKMSKAGWEALLASTDS